jgi:hypothetical protein
MENLNDAKSGKPVRSSGGVFAGINTIYRGEDGRPYTTRIWFWRLRLHIFHSGDVNEDPHNHPSDFWTFPFVSYVEEVTEPSDLVAFGYRKRLQVVPAWWLSYRPSSHTHRVIGAWSGMMQASGRAPAPYDTLFHDLYEERGYTPVVDHSRKIVTLVWFSKPNRSLGFLKNRDGKWCWIGWKEYIVGGGKDASCA